MKNNSESGEFCCLHICLFNTGKAIHFRTTLTPLRLLFLLLAIHTAEDLRMSEDVKFIPALRLHSFKPNITPTQSKLLPKHYSDFWTGNPTTWKGRHCSDGNAYSCTCANTMPYI